MKVRVRFDQTTEAALDWRRDGELCRFRFNGGEEREASVLDVEDGIASVLLDGRSYEVKFVRGIDCWYVDVRGHHMAIEVEDPRDAVRGAGALQSVGAQKVAAQMPGKVIRLLAAEGDTVEAGQGLLVVEAMKMQNELKSPKAGRVAAMLAREGATVAAGDVLATIE